MQAKVCEVNFDGIVGPTHNYSGLSYGNTASEKNRFQISNPREAALQGLEKMKFLADMGIKQAVLPPQERPFLPVLRQLGFTGSDPEILKNVAENAPELLLAVSSSAAMWTANAATVVPSADSFDKKLHLTPANLISKFHRSIEAATTDTVLRKIFRSDKHFVHHGPLPSSMNFADEGAANHTRFCKSHGSQGVNLFIFGRYAFQENAQQPKRYPARQTYEASLAISRLHALDPKKVLFAQQHPDAIDAGAFHNDVVAVGNQNVFFFHEQAFLNKDKLISDIRETVAKECQTHMIFLEVKAQDITLQDAISSYLFNSQLLTLENDSMALIAPTECQENGVISAYIHSLIKASDNPIQQVHFVPLRQSMENGGGPACLRLRVVMTETERSAAHLGVFFTEELYLKLKAWITATYRDRLEIKDLSDPLLYEESCQTLDELTKILNLGNLYSFQK